MLRPPAPKSPDSPYPRSASNLNFTNRDSDAAIRCDPSFPFPGPVIFCPGCSPPAGVPALTLTHLPAGPCTPNCAGAPALAPGRAGRGTQACVPSARCVPGRAGVDLPPSGQASESPPLAARDLASCCTQCVRGAPQRRACDTRDCT